MLTATIKQKDTFMHEDFSQFHQIDIHVSQCYLRKKRCSVLIVNLTDLKYK